MNDQPATLLVLQGGGPTPVINASLFGVIDESRRHAGIERILGARFGMQGLIDGDLVNLTSLPTDDLARLKNSPGASLGTSRTKPEGSNLEQIVESLRDLNVRWLLLIGGNGSLRGADAIGQAADRAGYDMCVIGVPKTVDNDLCQTDRCPGYASAAKFVAQSVRDLAMDVRTLPQPVSIFEAMGRSVGWLAAASALGRADAASAPHLVYLPERPFELDAFIGDVDDVVAKRGWAVVVVNEGIRCREGRPIFESTHASQRDALGRAVPGGVAAHLAQQVTTRLKLRCRWEQPGLCGRASMPHVAPQDRIDAEFVGRAAVRAAIEDEANHRHMISLRPLMDDRSEPTTKLVSLANLPEERAMPAEYLGDSPASPVTPAFLKYARRLVGDLIDFPTPLAEALPTFAIKEFSK